jgi:hypothetical protein
MFNRFSSAEKKAWPCSAGKTVIPQNHYDPFQYQPYFAFPSVCDTTQALVCMSLNTDNDLSCRTITTSKMVSMYLQELVVSYIGVGVNCARKWKFLVPNIPVQQDLQYTRCMQNKTCNTQDACKTRHPKSRDKHQAERFSILQLNCCNAGDFNTKPYN